MGAWGIHINENDAALDFIDEVVPAMCEIANNSDPNFERNPSYLVIAQFMIDYEYLNNGELIDEALSVVKTELDHVDDWDDNVMEARKNLLLKMKESLERLKANQ